MAKTKHSLVRNLKVANQALQSELAISIAYAGALRGDLAQQKQLSACYCAQVTDSNRGADMMHDLLKQETALRVKAQADLQAALVTIRNLSR